MAARASAYTHVDGDAATIEELTSCLLQSKQLLLNQHANIYDSVDMRVGINLSLLEHAKPLLEALVRIDPRGGMFMQSHFQVSLDRAFEGTKNEFLMKTLVLQKPYQEIIELMAYKIRVMLSHCRSIYDANGDDLGHPLASIFKIIRESPSSAASDARRTRRQHRLDKRPNPFICFREDEQPEPKEEQVEIITRDYDGRSRLAKLLLSDGTMINADKYEAGADGFVIAKWVAQNESLALEVPNQYLKGNTIIGSELRKRPTASSTRVGAKAAKREPEREKDESHEEDELLKEEVGVDGADDGAEPVQGEGNVFISLKIRPGHDNEMTIVCIGKDAKDKAQLLSVSPSSCTDRGKSPKEVCEHVIGLMQHELHGFKPPVAKSKWLSLLRDLARQHKRMFLSTT